jgi:hypothetical protein
MATNYVEPGSVISATMRPEDLIPAFLDALDAIKEAFSLDASVPEADRVETIARLDAEMGRIEQRMQSPGYWDGEDVNWDLEFLFDELDNFAPDGCYFGAHPGDGADYGFWTVESDDDGEESDDE